MNKNKHRRVLFLCHDIKNHGPISFVKNDTYTWKKEYLDPSAVRNKRTNQYTHADEIRGKSLYDIAFLVNCPIAPILGLDLTLHDNFYFVPLHDIIFEKIRLLKYQGLLIIPCYDNARVLLDEVRYVL